MRRLIFLFLFSSFAISSFGQLKKVLHQTFELDSVTNLVANVYDEYEVVMWAGNNVMSETTVELYSGSKGVLKHFIEAGRYQINLNRQGDRAVLVSQDSVRNPIRTSQGECSEIVQLKLFIPEHFQEAGQESWFDPTKKAAAEEAQKEEEKTNNNPDGEGN